MQNFCKESVNFLGYICCKLNKFQALHYTDRGQLNYKTINYFQDDSNSLKSICNYCYIL